MHSFTSICNIKLLEDSQTKTPGIGFGMYMLNKRHTIFKLDKKKLLKECQKRIRIKFQV